MLSRNDTITLGAAGGREQGAGPADDVQGGRKTGRQNPNGRTLRFAILS